MIYSLTGSSVEIVVTGNYTLGLGDLLYTRLGDRYILFLVTDFRGEIPIATKSIIPATMGDVPAAYKAEKIQVAIAEPIFEIRRENGGTVVVKPTQPPPLESRVYKLDPSSSESENIMSMLSEGIMPGAREAPDPVPVAWLRSGVAQSPGERALKYFTKATLKLDLSRTVPKHILVAGQTGAGKTSGVMGIIVYWAMNAGEKMGWLIIDRHGEYGRQEPGGRGFIDIVKNALKLNEKLRGRTKIYVYTTSLRGAREHGEGELLTRMENPINITSIRISDIGNALELSDERVSELEEALGIVSTTILGSNIDDSWKNIFTDKKTREPTGQLIALLTLLVDNLFNYEGVGEQEKKGLYRVILSAGVDIRKLRTFRRLILNLLGLRIKKEMVPVNGVLKPIAVLDDTGSTFKISPLLKNPLSLSIILDEIVKSTYNIYRTARSTRYPWRDIARKAREEGAAPPGLETGYDLGNLEKLVEDGNILVVDVSQIPINQGDVVVMSIIRRVFENRFGRGVGELASLPSIAIVSEEAPLYLSREKVRSPYNIFARIAKEGRKFKLGLIAITQLATLIENQILANFNTIIALRTKYSTDINYYKTIGIPGETLTSLGDREGYLYTPDLRVKEPIPVYIPGYFEFHNIIEERLRKERETSFAGEEEAAGYLLGEDE